MASVTSASRARGDIGLRACMQYSGRDVATNVVAHSIPNPHRPLSVMERERWEALNTISTQQPRTG